MFENFLLQKHIKLCIQISVLKQSQLQCSIYLAVNKINKLVVGSSVFKNN